LTVFSYKMSVEAAQTLKWASFISLFWAYFRERGCFCGLFKGGVLVG
jgi:hypothetical protein